MKAIVLMVTAILAAASAAPVDTVRALILGLRDQMPCGFPEYNLPALAPFLLQTLKLDNPGLFLKVDDLRLDGLNSFEIDSLTLNVLVFKMSFAFRFKEIRLRTKYETDIELGGIDIEGIGGMAKIFGKGDVDFGVRNLSIAGNLALQFHPGGGSSLKEFNLGLDVDDVYAKFTGLMGNEIVNDFVNDLLVSVVMTFAKEMKGFVSENLVSFVKPVVDGLLVHVTVNDILGWINGGGNAGPTKPPCIAQAPDISFLNRLH